MTTTSTDAGQRETLVRRGQRLEHFTIAYNALEGLASIVAGVLAGSIALVGCGVDSVIEVTSAVALLWRLHVDADQERRERSERVTLRIVGVCFLALAAYIAFEQHRLPDPSLVTGTLHPRYRDHLALRSNHAVAQQSEA